MLVKSLVSALFILSLVPGVIAQETGPADPLWDLYRQGEFESVVVQGKAMLATENETAQVNLAVGRSLVHLEKYDDAFVFLSRAVELDSRKTWVYAWAQVYLGISHFETGNEDRARQAWILARDCQATRNATRSAETSLKLLGLSEFFDKWEAFETQHFSCRFSGRLIDFNRVEYARSLEEAYDTISTWFGGGPDEKIRFLLWANQAEADEAGMPPMSFSNPEEYLTHSLRAQPMGYELTHIISLYALNPTIQNGLISEGIAVHMDLTGRNQMKQARKVLAESNPKPLEVSIPALWLDWTLSPEEFSLPVAGAFVNMLVEKGGKKRFLEFFKDQSYEHALLIYGDGLKSWINDFEEELYR